MEDIHIKEFSNEIEKISEETKKIPMTQGIKASWKATNFGLDPDYMADSLKESVIYGGGGTAVGTGLGMLASRLGRGKVHSDILKYLPLLFGAFGGGLSFGIGSEVGQNKFLRKKGIKKTLFLPRFRATNAAIKKYKIKE